MAALSIRVHIINVQKMLPPPEPLGALVKGIGAVQHNRVSQIPLTWKTYPIGNVTNVSVD